MSPIAAQNVWTGTESKELSFALQGDIDQELSFQVTSSNPELLKAENISISYSLTGGTIELTPETGVMGSSTVTITYGTIYKSTSQSFEFQVRPIASPSTSEDQALTYDLSSLALSGFTVTGYEVDTPAIEGSVAITSQGLLIYTPPTDQNASTLEQQLIQYRLISATGAVIQGMLQVTVVPENDPPVVAGFALSTPEETPVSIQLSASDVDGDALTYEVLTAPAIGSLSGSAPSLTFTPEANFNGTVTLTYRAFDGTAHSPSATITITVSSVNVAPEVAHSSITTSEDTAYASNGSTRPHLAATDIDGDSLTFSVITPSAHGSVTIGANGSFTYTPDSEYSGSDSFTYRAFDGALYSESGTVSITILSVNDLPLASNITITTAEDTTYSSDGSTRPHLPASDADGTSVTCSLFSSPSHGSLSILSNCSFTYHPTTDFSGADSFTYRVASGGQWSSPATVTVVVSPVNDPPTGLSISAITSPAATEREAYTLTFEQIASKATLTDSDGGTISHFLLNSEGGIAPSFVKNPGAVPVSFGTTRFFPGEWLVFTPVTSGTLGVFSVRAYDGAELSPSLNAYSLAGAWVNLAITSVNDTPTLDPISPVTRTYWSPATVTLTNVTNGDNSAYDSFNPATLNITTTLLSASSAEVQSALVLPTMNSGVYGGISTYLLSFPEMTAPITSGTAEFLVTVSDGVHSTSQSLSMTIDGSLPTPVAHLVSDVVNPGSAIQLVAQETCAPGTLNIPAAEGLTFEEIAIPTSSMAVTRKAWSAIIASDAPDGTVTITASETCGAPGAQVTAAQALTFAVSAAAETISLDHPVIRTGGATPFRMANVSGTTGISVNAGSVTPNAALGLLGPGVDALWMAPTSGSTGIYTITSSGGATARVVIDATQSSTVLLYAPNGSAAGDTARSWTVGTTSSRAFETQYNGATSNPEFALFFSEPTSSGSLSIYVHASTNVFYSGGPAGGESHYFFKIGAETGYHRFVITSCSWGGDISGCTDSSSCNSNGGNWRPTDGACLAACGGGSSWDSTAYSCTCPGGTSWDGDSCESICTAGTTWNGESCVSVCGDGFAWSSSTLACESICGSGTYYNGLCYYDTQSLCSAKGWYFDGTSCTATGTDSYCAYSNAANPSYYWNGSGCTLCQSGAGNYWDGDSCEYHVDGCTDSTADNYNPGATRSNGQCSYSCSSAHLDLCYVSGNCASAGGFWTGSSCSSSGSDSYCSYTNEGNPHYRWNGSSCITCDPSAGNTWNGSTCVPPVSGCMDPGASNYDPSATVSSGSCIYPVCSSANLGACDSLNCSSVGAGFWNGSSCVEIVTGCMDPAATNYNASANTSNGSCTFCSASDQSGCTSGNCGSSGGWYHSGTCYFDSTAYCQSQGYPYGYQGGCYNDSTAYTCATQGFAYSYNGVCHADYSSYCAASGTCCGPGLTWNTESESCVSLCSGQQTWSADSFGNGACCDPGYAYGQTGTQYGHNGNQWGEHPTYGCVSICHSGQSYTQEQGCYWPAPPPATSLTAASSGPSSVSLNWTPSGWSASTGFVQYLERTTAMSGSCDSSWNKVATSESGASGCSGISIGTNYGNGTALSPSGSSFTDDGTVTHGCGAPSVGSSYCYRVTSCVTYSPNMMAGETVCSSSTSVTISPQCQEGYDYTGSSCVPHSEWLSSNSRVESGGTYSWNYGTQSFSCSGVEDSTVTPWVCYADGNTMCASSPSYGTGYVYDSASSPACVDQRPPAVTDLASDSSLATAAGSVHLTWTNTWTNTDDYGNYFSVYQAALTNTTVPCPAATEPSWSTIATSRYQVYNENSWSPSNLDVSTSYCFRVEICNGYGCSSSNIISASPVDTQTACGNSGQHWCSSGSGASYYSFCATDADSCSETQASDACYSMEPAQYYVSGIGCVSTQAEASCRNIGYYWSSPGCFYSSADATASQSGKYWYGGSSSNRTQDDRLIINQISTAYHHVCGITPAGKLYCWGQNHWNQITEGSASGSLMPPVEVLSSRILSQVSVTESYSCALEAGTGDAYCWGLATSSPTKISGRSFSKIDLGGSRDACGIEAGALYCWTAEAPTPVAVNSDTDWTDVSVGGSHRCALKSSGAAYCWGSNQTGGLGTGGSEHAASPAAVAGGLSFASISAGSNHTCALTASGTAYCWGHNLNGQVGDGGTTNRLEPVAVSGLLTFSKISAGNSSTCTTTGAGALYCWGSLFGLGNVTSPHPQASLISWSDVSGSCGVSASPAFSAGSVLCWGDNSSGVFGSPNLSVVASFSDPVVVPATRPACDFDFGTLRCRNHTASPVPDFAITNSGCPTSLAWTATGADYYNIYRNAGDHGPVLPTPINATPITSTTYSDWDSLSQGPYHYEIEGCDYFYGCSSRSSVSASINCSQ